MTLYYTLVFVLLITEMTMFMLLIIPLPFTWRRKLFTFVSESPVIAKLQYGMKICFIFILILFVDSVHRVYRVQLELAAASESHSQSRTTIIGSERMEVQARKFYSQRNMYLCGFTLFLSLILNRTYVMILDVLRLEERVQALQGSSKTGGKESEKLANAGAAGEVGRLREEVQKKEKTIEELRVQLEKKSTDMETLKKQVDGVSREYDALAEKYGATQSDGSTKKQR